MELFFIGPVLLPLTPAKIEENAPSGNETVRLVNDGEINIRHKPGLKTISFDVVLPCDHSYPFQIYSMAGMEASAFKAYFETLHKRQIPFPFIQITWDNSVATVAMSATGALLKVIYSNVLCTIEEMTDLRDAENGQDKVISLVLKEFKDYGTQYAKVNNTQDGEVTYEVTSKVSFMNYEDELCKLGKDIVAKTKKAWGVASDAWLWFSELGEAGDSARDTVPFSHEMLMQGQYDDIWMGHTVTVTNNGFTVTPK